ncbi:MAG TPA: tetratricopeptide repeat protein [Sedimentisphaerales bacterium]|nr:tetratricopeptide repeat protein [Sedimentisphaerales bacterium]HRS11513.1 tetratricopeptide repeat protein [Sedimentisphaerales bacterium]HRV48235.1 tetratricopeptide repeat protein [Sedimentisphaerales bacterium]
MAEGQVIYPRPRKDWRELRELVANGSYSIILVVIALIAIRPLMVRHILDRADAYSALRQYDDARRQCDKALLIDGDNGRAWYVLACLHKAQGELDAAYGAYQKATEADPANVPANFELALMYVQDGQLQQAVPYLEQVRQVEADRANRYAPDQFAYHRAALDMLVMCYEKLGDEAKAKFTREELRVYYPHHTQMGEPAKATQTAAQAG